MAIVKPSFGPVGLELSGHINASRTDGLHGVLASTEGVPKLKPNPGETATGHQLKVARLDLLAFTPLGPSLDGSGSVKMISRSTQLTTCQIKSSGSESVASYRFKGGLSTLDLDSEELKRIDEACVGIRESDGWLSPTRLVRPSRLASFEGMGGKKDPGGLDGSLGFFEEAKEVWGGKGLHLKTGLFLVLGHLVFVLAGDLGFLLEVVDHGALA